MIAFLKREWGYVIGTFRGSETIIWARLQYVFGVLLAAFHSVDLTPFISDKNLLIAYMFVNAIITEGARRNREDWSGGIR